MPHPATLPVCQQNLSFELDTDSICGRALCITFYRPFLRDGVPQDVPTDAREDWQAQMQTKSEAAAFQTNVLLEKIAREKLLSFAGSMT